MSSALAFSLPETPMDVLVARTCPTCHAPAPNDADVRAATPAETLSYDDLSKSWRGFFGEHSFFSYHRCTQCDQLFAPTYINDQTIGEFYAAMDDNIHSGDEYLSTLTQQEYVAATGRHAQAPKRYLEIGPDIGLFLADAKSRYPLTDAILVEPNQKVWPRLREAASGLKTTIVSSLGEVDMQVADGSLDLVVAIHVLDHLLEPEKTLGWIKRKLAPGGVAVFVVHNERSLLARLIGNRWPAYCMQHPQLYNPATLRAAIAHSGLAVPEVKRTANYFPANYLIEHGLYVLTKKRFKLGWPTFSLRLKLGNIVAIATNPA